MEIVDIAGREFTVTQHRRSANGLDVYSGYFLMPNSRKGKFCNTLILTKELADYLNLTPYSKAVSELADIAPAHVVACSIRKIRELGFETEINVQNQAVYTPTQCRTGDMVYCAKAQKMVVVGGLSATPCQYLMSRRSAPGKNAVILEPHMAELFYAYNSGEVCRMLGISGGAYYAWRQILCPDLGWKKKSPTQLMGTKKERIWRLVMPDGATYECRDLKRFVHENIDVFPPCRVDTDKTTYINTVITSLYHARTQCKTYKGITVQRLDNSQGKNA